jgi:hypothetical protein
MVLAPHKAFSGKEEPRFSAGAAASYSHQTSDQVTIGVAAYVTDEQARPAFGKHNPYNYGVLPVLVVVQNDSRKAIRLDNMQAVLVAPDRSRIDATPAGDVRFLNGPRQPKIPSGPLPHIGGHKNPLNNWAIQGRAFAAQMLPPGQSASGFFYFQSGYQKGLSIYLSGLREADNGRELLYFEIPLAEK